MSCFSPLKGYAEPVTGAFTLKPTYNRRDLDPMQVPCGKCIGCDLTRRRDWTIRMAHEAQMHLWAWFLTLTYSNEFLPDWASLRMTDGPEFVQALRRKRKGDNIRYFCAGEYGEQFLRPHLHMAIFGLRLDDVMTSGSSRMGNALASGFLTEMWGKGHVGLSAFTPANAAYIAGYVRKKGTKQEQEELYTRWDSLSGEIVLVDREKATMSKRPAIGRTWLEKYFRDVYPSGKVVHNGYELPPPRYYDLWLAENHPEMWAEVKAKREEDAWKQEQLGEHTPERLKTREAVATARAGLRKRMG